MSILVFVEQRDGQVRSVSREALGQATALAATFGGPVVAVCCAAADPGLAALGEAGAEQVLFAQHEAFASYDGAGYAAAVAAAIASVNPKVVLFAGSSMGRDLAPRVAAKVDAGLATDCTALVVDGGKLVATRPVYAGKALQKVSFPGAVALATLRPKAFAAPEAQAGKTAAVSALAFTWDASAPRAKVTAVVGASGGKVDLTEAEAIVAGGRGMKGPEHFAMLEELAGVLGVRRGRGEHRHRRCARRRVRCGAQLGRTGKTVSPKLYIAVGVSGAIQHLAGMSSSRCIVAINKDPEAPIFKVADYGIVGDLFEVLPALTAAIKQLH